MRSNYKYQKEEEKISADARIKYREIIFDLKVKCIDLPQSYERIEANITLHNHITTNTLEHNHQCSPLSPVIGQYPISQGQSANNTDEVNINHQSLVDRVSKL